MVAAVSPPGDLTLACWALLEVGLRVREGAQGKGSRSEDRGTRDLVAISIGAAVGAALVASSLASPLRMPRGPTGRRVGVMWLGLALRIWSIATLGGAFRTTVEVDPARPWL